jgi:hypothetical protein
MIEQTAMEGPEPRVVSVENDDDAAPRWHQHGIAYSARKSLAVDLYDLELCPCKCIGCDMLVRLIMTSSTR